MEILTLSAVAPITLIAIGIFLIAVEAITFTFVLFWFGVSFVLVGFFSYFINFSDGAWQLALIGITSLVLLFALRTKALKIFLKAKDNDEVKDYFLNTQGYGVVNHGKIYYKATFWNCDDIQNLKEGQKVQVLEAKKGKVIIKYDSIK